LLGPERGPEILRARGAPSGRHRRRVTMPKIFLPTPLRPFAEGAASVEASGSTVSEALEPLVSRYAGLRAHLFDGSGKLRAFVNVYKNDEDIRHLDRGATGLADGDTLSIVPSIAGGSPPAAALA